MKEASQLVRLADLWNAYDRRLGGAEPDWTRFAVFLDVLNAEPERTAEAIRVSPPRQTLRAMAALLAGIAEKLADDAHLDRPGWTATAPVLAEGEWPIPGTPRMQAAIRAAAPVQLLRRGVVVDVGSLWRHRADVHA